MPDLPVWDYTGQRMEGGAEERVACEEGGMGAGHGNRQFCPGMCKCIDLHTQLFHVIHPTNEASLLFMTALYLLSPTPLYVCDVCDSGLWESLHRQTLSFVPMWETSSLLVGQRGIPSLRRDLLYLSPAGPL